MARIRTIKPEFFTSEDIVCLTPHARLLYIALWCEADREGRMAWKPRTFKMRYLPADSVDIDLLCGELLAAGLVRLYGDSYAYIPCFSRHQHVNPRESVSTLPAPPDFEAEHPKKITEETRELVMSRDGWKCVRCNSTEDLTLDHILPQSLGGPHIQENLRCMCRSCNSKRPVSGQGLVDDLARDGLTVDGLRVKFAIDAHLRVSTRANDDLNTQVGKERKGRKEPASCDARFELFWQAYPKKVGKDSARKAFDKRKPDEQMVSEMVRALEIQKQTEQWTKNNGEFVPHPATWLNAGRWMDELPSDTKTLSIFAGAI